MSILRITDVATGEDRTKEYSLVNLKQAEGYKQVIEAERYSALTKDGDKEASLGTRRNGESIESLRGCSRLICILFRELMRLSFLFSMNMVKLSYSN
ncbi:hypothetical protein COJ67_16595 [Bacillus thuringiensis]|uniref:hypothetical protein n=1 Tax=Bacillus thuringiensis TaxID=1428 RepID=UPI000BF8E3C3|nr:hypothetical protein [Bacillus thuringiensis]PFN86367.1 hypothetical protein COJ67_16595 [Bacillus thuringiensis]PGX99255.1 hypothetical protein COE41_17290 [Bacillus thuringiensis]